MHTLTRRTFVMVAMLAASVIAQAQTATQNAPTSSVTGRVTIGEKAAAGIIVSAELPYDSPPRRSSSPTQRAVTDADGRYRIANLPAGRYIIAPVAPSFVVPRESPYGQPGKSLNLSDGDSVDGIDFALTRGAVITGRVVDADGRAVIEERVNLRPVEELGKPQNRNIRFEQVSGETDDRGVYRIYGLPAGRYKVSVGAGSNEAGRSMYGGGRGYYALTFHPNVTDEAKAEIVEVAEGGEVSGVDITPGRREQTFSAHGKIIDAESGKPVGNLILEYGTMLKNGGSFLMTMSMDGQVNARGEFQIPGLAPGHYAVYGRPEDGSEYYSEPLMFEITDADVSGLVVKMRRGGSVSGVVVLEGTRDRTVLAKMANLHISASVLSSSKMETPNSKSTIVAADGSFRINGLGVGKAQIYPDLYRSGNGSPVSGLTLLRIERDGVAQPREGIQIGAGEQVTGIRIVLGYGTGIVRGQVRFEGGARPTGARIFVQLQRPETSAGNMQYFRPSEVDARGHFMFENLVAGEYQVRLFPSNGWTGTPQMLPAPQTINVIDGVEAEVTFVVNLAAENQERQP